MKHFFLITVLAISLLSCNGPGGGKHLIMDKSYREAVHAQFLNRRELASGRDSVLFSVFNHELTTAEREGLEFLYAYMPLSDLAMNDGHYYLRQVQTALEAREHFSWGNTIPEDIFLHFVLPYRVNNEYTDTARQVFYKELKERLGGMDMTTAALEVNHWCHEKVIYKSTDERTSGPLTTVRTAFGRCGEESTFTVSAMRVAGIPARQVYTPRWAHTDDNHAWVEVWIDGKWHFLGACEPEPALDMAWFAEPVKRAMMTHTFVFGKYNGSEEVTRATDFYARLNLLTNYTKTRPLTVTVVNEEGKPLENASVEFGLYNYAEFYPVSTLLTGSDGTCTLTTGYGDLMIQATLNGVSAAVLSRGSKDGNVTVTLGKQTEVFPEGEYLLVPPVKQAIPATDPVMAARNNRRLLEEDSIRSIYISTFIDSVSTVSLAASAGAEPDKLWKYMAQSRGNWPEIKAFIENTDKAGIETAMLLLENISEKDLHDIRASVLSDHLAALNETVLAPGITPEQYNRYVLSPRIGREFVTTWRSYIRNFFPPQQAEQFREDPASVREWISNNIRPDTINNYYGVPLSPEGMLELKLADPYSRDLLFVAISRSFGTPSRLEPSTRRPQFLNKGEWIDVSFTPQPVKRIPRGQLVLTNESRDPEFVPGYYTHYTIARLEKGRFITLDYETDATLRRFPATLSVDTGFYRLMTGNRLSEGEVACNIRYFRVVEGKTTSMSIRLASGSSKSGTLGFADPDASFREINGNGRETLRTVQTAKGMVVAIIDPSKEPTKHLMEDIRSARGGLNAWGGNVVFVVAGEKLTRGFRPSVYKDLPASARFGYDDLGEIASAISTTCSIKGIPQWPVVAVINGKGEITWHSEGYSIGLGDQILKQLSLLQK